MGEEGDGKKKKRRVTTPDHPPYSEMVQVALRSLAEAEGSTASSISSFIVSAYPSLPPAHSNFLPYYLRKLLLSADIIITSHHHHHHHPPRFSLPPSPTPTPPVPAPPVSPVPRYRRRGRPCKYDPIQDPSVTTRTGRSLPGVTVHPVPRCTDNQRKYDPIQEPSVTNTIPSRKLILHLKKRRKRNGDGDEGGGAGWFLLRAGDDKGRGCSSPMVEVSPPPATRLLPDAESVNKPEDMYSCYCYSCCCCYCCSCCRFSFFATGR